MREIIKLAALDATEKISYGMLCYWQKENLVYFGAAKNHIGFYPTSERTAAFEEKLEPYSPSKGTIRFPLKKEIPFS